MVAEGEAQDFQGHISRPEAFGPTANTQMRVRPRHVRNLAPCICNTAPQYSDLHSCVCVFCKVTVLHTYERTHTHTHTHIHTHAHATSHLTSHLITSQYITRVRVHTHTQRHKYKHKPTHKRYTHIHTQTLLRLSHALYASRVLVNKCKKKTLPLIASAAVSRGSRHALTYYVYMNIYIYMRARVRHFVDFSYIVVIPDCM